MSEKIPFIDLKVQYKFLEESINSRIKKVLDHGQYIMGPEVGELESRLAEYTGAKYCITAASGTEALLMSLMAIGIKPGDEVITTPFTFVATAEVIVLLGATPVLADIQAETCNIDPSKIEGLISSRTKAIIPVSLYGQPADMDEINKIAEKYGLIVIEDAAQSFGSIYKGRRSGNLSKIGCTSFFPSKPLGCYGDGGAIFTSDEEIAKACREIRVHGQSKRYYHTRIGLGGRMDTMQCAIVLAKLDRFEWEVEMRAKIGGYYNKALDAKNIRRVVQKDDRTSVFAQYTIFTENRANVQERLEEKGIPTAVHYPIPINEQPAYAGLCGGGDTPVAKKAARCVMSLPMGPDLSYVQVEKIVAAL